MNEEIKKKWVEALRSGKYKQGEGYLRSADDKFCCLGVLCDIVSPEGWAKCLSGRYNHGVNGITLPGKVSEATGVTSQGGIAVPVAYGGTTCHFLIELNDAGATFEEIADVIEEQF